MIRQSYQILLIVTALLLAVPSASAFGQLRDVPPRYEEFGIVCLLGFPSVIDHLKADYELAEDKAKTLKELGRNRLRNMHLRRDFRMKTRKLTDSQFAKARAELCNTIQKSNDESWTKAKELLTEKQIARLQELRIQRLGPAALMDSEVLQALDIKADQLDQHLASAMTAKKLHDKALLQLRADLLASRRGEKFAPQSRADLESNRAISKALADAKISERDKVFAAVLNDEQQTKLNSLTGAPFIFKLDFDFPRIKVDWQIAPVKQIEN